MPCWASQVDTAWWSSLHKRWKQLPQGRHLVTCCLAACNCHTHWGVNTVWHVALSSHIHAYPLTPDSSSTCSRSHKVIMY
jgi:hypothetical protein